jgi:hypothetical protein
MKRPVAIGFAHAVHALIRRAQETHVRLAAQGIDGESRFELAERANGTAPTEPAIPIWRGTISRTGGPR